MRENPSIKPTHDSNGKKRRRQTTPTQGWKLPKMIDPSILLCQNELGGITAKAFLEVEP